MQGKKWMMVLTGDQVDWLRSTAEKAGVSGSDIGREAINAVMADRHFITRLAAAQLKNELDALEYKKTEIAKQEAELKAKMRQEKVAI